MTDTPTYRAALTYAGRGWLTFAMTDDARIRQTSAVLRRALKAFNADDYRLKLNSMTNIMADILQDQEGSSPREAYQRMADVFGEAALNASAAPPILRRVTNSEQAARLARLVAQLIIPDPRRLGTAIDAARQVNGGDETGGHL